MAAANAGRGYSNAAAAVPLVLAALHKKQGAELETMLRAWTVEGDATATIRNILAVTAGVSSLAAILLKVLATELNQPAEEILEALAGQMTSRSS